VRLPMASHRRRMRLRFRGRWRRWPGGSVRRRAAMRRGGGQLAQLAGAANGLIKAGDLAGAAQAIAGLGAAIEGGSGAGAGSNPAPTAAPGGGPVPNGDELLALFRDAKEEVDAGISKLQEALRATEDVDFIRIAEYGIYGMTNGEGVGLMKALIDFRKASAEQQGPLLQAVRSAAVAYKAAVFKHPLADLVDENPFGVSVGMKALLGPALDRIAAA